MRLIIDNVSVELGRLQKVNSTLVIPEFVPVAEIDGEEKQLVSTRIHHSKISGDLLGTTHVVGYTNHFVPVDVIDKLDMSINTVNLLTTYAEENKDPAKQTQIQEELKEAQETLNKMLISAENTKWKKKNPETGELEDSPLFQRTEEILPKFIRPRDELANWKIEEYYTLPISKSTYKNEFLRAAQEQKRFEKAEEWIAANQMGVLPFTHRTGKTTWVAFLYPIIKEIEEEGRKTLKYAWVLATSNTKIDWQQQADLLTDVPKTSKVQALPEPELDIAAIL